MSKQFTNQNGSINTSEMWKLKKKLWPKKASSLPAAKFNHRGKLVSTAGEVKMAIKKEYTERLRRRPLHPKITKLYKQKTIYTRSPGSGLTSSTTSFSKKKIPFSTQC